MTDDTTITDSERDLLRFPADPDILRFGTPVCGVNPERTCKGQAVILSAGQWPGEARVAYARDIFPPEWVSLDDIALDLTDATGRAHLAWWIARELRATIYDPSESGDRGQPAWVYAAGPHAWSIERVGHSYMWTRWSAGCDEPVIDLDPDDPRLLPDGSRLVDALALSLVGRHLLAGGGR